MVRYCIVFVFLSTVIRIPEERNTMGEVKLSWDDAVQQDSGAPEYTICLLFGDGWII